MRENDITILVIGSGAREHVLAMKAKLSPLVGRVLCSPGNGGFSSRQLRNVKETDLGGIVKLAIDEKADLVIIGPEVPCSMGLVNHLTENGIAAFGPTARMSVLESSKAYTKRLCEEYGIPTARFYVADSMADAVHWIRLFDSPPVIKADGLCAGKGVVVAKSHNEAIDVAEEMLVEGIHGEAGNTIVIEERLVGRECSIMGFCDGENVRLLPPARDYKRIRDGDQGPNTGGMGSYSPLPDVDDALLERIKDEIFLPALRGFKAQEGIPYHGALLYAGLMLTSYGPMLIELNVRFGDPETQVILARTESDIVPYMLASRHVGGLANLPEIKVSSQAAVCVVLAAAGYPGKYNTGMLLRSNRKCYRDVVIAHAGTEPHSRPTRTKGGRVLSVIGTGPSIYAAREAAYAAADDIPFDGKQYRTDIAKDAE